MTDKSAAAIREFAEKWAFVQYKDELGLLIDDDRTGQFISDLTALISEGYVSKEEHDKVVQQRDELREALNNVMVIIKDCYPLLFDNEKPVVKQAEAAIKNTENYV